MRLLIVFIGILFCNEIQAQCDRPFFRTTGTMIRDVSVIDTNKFVAVGDNGYIIKSVDGGKNWKNIRTYNTYILGAVQFPTDSVGYAVGSYKTMLKTEDQGETWFPVYVNITGYTNVYSPFTDLYFFNKDRGYIVGGDGKFASTSDGGKSWRDTTLSFSDGMNSITFTNDSTGYICGSSALLYKTTDRGKTWQHIPVPAASQFASFAKIRFINESIGFIIGVSGLCLRTVDAGLTWTSINTPTSGEYYDIYFQNATKGFIVGTYAGGLILQTNDAGLTWNAIFNYPGRYASYYSINPDPSRKKMVIAGGGDFSEFLGYNGRNILSSTDSGTTYNPLSRNGRIQYNDICFLNDSSGYIAGDEGIILRTHDFGESWKPLQTIPAVIGGNSALKIFFLDSLHGFAATDNVYKTSNGGSSWTITSTPGGGSQFTASQMFFMDNLKGLVLNQGGIYKTINAGDSWTNVVTSNFFFTDFTFTAAGKGFAVGYDGECKVTTDEGSTWTPFNLNTLEYLTTVYFYNNNIGFIGTEDSTLFKTTDGGSSWTVMNGSGLPNFRKRSFRFINDSTGYVLCNEGGGISAIYKTTNGGFNWSLITQPNENCSRLAGFKTIYTAGGNGLILRTDTLQKPTLPGYITGPDKACLGTKSNYITGVRAAVNYNWSLSGGGINSYSNNKDTVLWNNSGVYTLSLSVSNACGTSPVRTITTSTILFQPVITVVDSVLSVTPGVTYQWYLNSSPISVADGGTSVSIIAHIPGYYTVQVKSDYGCTVTTPAVNYAGLPASDCPNGNTSITSNLTATTYQWQRNDGTGYINISNSSNYSGTNGVTLSLTNIPSSWYGYTFRCITSAGTSYVYALRFINYWTGAVSSAWENPSNWSCGQVPDANTDVVINSGTVIINSNVTIRQLTLNTAANLTVHVGNVFTVLH